MGNWEGEMRKQCVAILHISEKRQQARCWYTTHERMQRRVNKVTCSYITHEGMQQRAKDVTMIPYT